MPVRWRTHIHRFAYLYGMAQHFTIEGSAIHDIASFYAEINRVFMAGESWQIGPSLDALNDLLHGGIGRIGGAGPVVVTWKDMAQTRAALGHTATERYYEDKLRPGSPFNHGYFRERLAALRSGDGQTYFDLVMAVFADHPNITVNG